MRKNSFSTWAIFFAMIVLSVSCEKNKLWVGNVEYFIGTYSNSNGTPNFEIYEQSKYLALNQESIKTEMVDGEVKITVDGIQISNENYNFQVTNIEISECTSSNCSKGDYAVISESTGEESSIETDVVAVLVLDMSSSLGNNVGDVKEYAKTFAASIVSLSANSYVGVVLFSDGITSSPFYNKDQLGELNTFIDNFTDYQGTQLYGACKAGIDLLNSSQLEGDKNLIIFTDGRDTETNNPGTVKNEVILSPITRFVIGVQGADFAKDELKELATKKGTFFVAKDFTDLSDAFERVSRQVATIYSVSYSRSDQLLDTPIKIKFLFDVDKP